ncbi:cytochrome d ubiquinol oxidase subunit II [Gordonia sp. PP30]|uniref:cytochrome d ubiquinol oxidase subunit II n=1 Tax=unclassified Gordonia (in: high G+C Gram-positive bacteria) TaxID=2657482 RepID=UPI001FFE38B5|nr:MULTISPECIES: cytochrome d ubiquinol oxidase subunit II [unclassified Gordonia (in: high G+C Gram-positive bacteria)]UQE75715.1 cytochrome d ubiquinol oxidase subunit II [Gordonia sp. PP30]
MNPSALEIVWFVLIAVLFTGYFVLEGFDFGVGMLMPFLGRSSEHDGDKRRRLIINTIGPVWDGNEVWLLTAGGALFAAFGGWYATMFSGFYLPLFLILLALIVRVCAIEWRAKINDPRWRLWCDVGIGIGSWVPALLWGVAFANVVRGVPIEVRGPNHVYTGGFWNLLNPYGIVGGLTTLVVFLTHGAIFIALKTKGQMRDDATKLAAALSVAMLVIAGTFLLWTQLAYGKDWTWALVVIGALAAVGVVIATNLRREGWAFLGTAIAIAATVGLLFGSLYPYVMPSTLGSDQGLTIMNSSSSQYTLVIMTWAAVIMTPIVIGYQAWSYWVFRKRLSIDDVPETPAGLSLKTTV